MQCNYYTECIMRLVTLASTQEKAGILLSGVMCRYPIAFKEPQVTLDTGNYYQQYYILCSRGPEGGAARVFRAFYEHVDRTRSVSSSLPSYAMTYRRGG